MTDKEQMGRLALRVEGDFWVAYYAMPKTMNDAILLGSIRMAFVQGFAAKEIFMSLMRDAVSSIIKEQTGVSPHWPDPHGVSAPEHEKSGRA